MEIIKATDENRIDVGTEVPATVTWVSLDKEEITTEIDKVQGQIDSLEVIKQSFLEKLAKFETPEAKAAIAEVVQASEAVEAPIASEDVPVSEPLQEEPK